MCCHPHRQNFLFIFSKHEHMNNNKLNKKSKFESKKKNWCERFGHTGDCHTEIICENSYTEIGTKLMSRLAAPYLLCSIVVFIIFFWFLSFFLFTFKYKIKR